MLLPFLGKTNLHTQRHVSWMLTQGDRRNRRIMQDYISSWDRELPNDSNSIVNLLYFMNFPHSSKRKLVKWRAIVLNGQLLPFFLVRSRRASIERFGAVVQVPHSATQASILFWRLSKVTSVYGYCRVRIALDRQEGSVSILVDNIVLLSSLVYCLSKYR